MLHADDVRSTAAVRFGAYLCLRLSDDTSRALAALDVPGLAAQLGLRNEYHPGGDHPASAIAYLRRVAVTPADTADEGLSRAEVIVHVAADSPEPVAELRAALARDVPPACLRVLDGVVRPPSYTGNALHNFAYAHRVLQQPGVRMPNVFLLPMSKTQAWWAKSWLERHTYILPRYDEAGQMLNEGHALVCEPGIACLMRRTYKQLQEPAAPGGYDFINYFECADADVPVFHAVCAALRDTHKNPEWQFVREGPLWQGRRVESWQAVLA